MDSTYGNIIEITKKNNHYRHIHYTGKDFQIILQALLYKEDVPEEIHDSVQFIFCVSGSGIVSIEGKNNILRENIFCIVPVGNRHSIMPTSDVFKFFTIYNSVEHDPNVMEKRQPTKYTVGDKYILSKNNNNNNWSFIHKDDETKLCEHEFKNVKKLATDLYRNDDKDANPCPLCIIHSKDL